MSERALWRALREKLAPYGILKRIEDSLSSGTPDVAYCLLGASGWLELKHLDAWPIRPDTIVRVPPHTQAQTDFMSAWASAGGRAWMLLQVDREYLLLGPDAAYDLSRGLLPKAALIERAAIVEAGTLPALKILKFLTQSLAPRMSA